MNRYKKVNTMQIGNFSPKNPYFLAPMAGITDWPFRVLCAENGAGLVYSEMLNARAMHYQDIETLRMATTHPLEKPIAIQLFGHEPDYIAEAVRYFCTRPDIALIDINMGCPTPKITKNGDGSALLQNLPLAEEILKAAVKAADEVTMPTNTQSTIGTASCLPIGATTSFPKPITVKIRKGWDSTAINYIETAKMAEAAGVSAIALHARTREEMYTGSADWNCIANLKKAVSIPIIGNGDIHSIKEAEQRMQQTGCDAVMIGRATQGNPWVFTEQGREGINKETLLQTILQHYAFMAEAKGERTATLEMRKHIAWYLHGLHGAAAIRLEVYSASEMQQVLEILSKYFQEMYSF